MAKGRVISTHQKRDIIFSQGDPADAVFYIRKGKVKITVLFGQLRQGRKTGASYRKNQPGDAGRDDRHDSIAREPFHE